MALFRSEHAFCVDLGHGFIRTFFAQFSQMRKLYFLLINQTYERYPVYIQQKIILYIHR